MKESEGEVGIPDLTMCAQLVPAARLVRELGSLRDLAHLGLGPVLLHPHQAYAVDFTLSKYPHRALLADEVGLGKTIEAGAVIKRLVSSGRAQRVLILSPKNVARQWMDEMWGHFGLRFWLFDPGNRVFRAADDSIIPIQSSENPFDRSGIDFMIVSWHYARGSKRREPEVLRAEKSFDLVVVDEAHHARRRRYLGKAEATRLHDLLTEISVASPHMLLVTATPVQLYAAEAMDLLRILGLGGRWVHEEDFNLYYDVVVADAKNVNRTEWISCLDMASWIARKYLSEDETQAVVKNILPDSAEILHSTLLTGNGLDRLLNMFLPHKTAELKQLLLALNPVQWFMVRNTRDRLKQLGYSFPERDISEEPVELDSKHRVLLERMDMYLRSEYGLYEKIISGENRSVIGFVRSVYHQRFVSSFTAAYLTPRNRREFLEALLSDDREAVLRAAARLLDEEEWEGDEEDVAEAMKEANREAILNELQSLRQLELELLDYAPDNLTRADPKLRKVLSVVDDLLSAGRKVLIFSKYADTVDAVSRFLARESKSLNKAQISIYTGDGGRVYDSKQEMYVPVSKGEVVRQLTDGEVRVLVCSEAASEGLNLQAASAVINVDMPWNPAKVEQRIGRVDRLGQKAAVVLVKNIWYPDSIEAEMYRALFQRREIYGLVVGPAKEIISEGLRRALDEGETAEGVRKIVSETLRKVEEVKEQAARVKGSLIGASWERRIREDEDAISRLARFALKAARALNLKAVVKDGVFRVDEEHLPNDLKLWNNACLEAGRPNALTAAHPILQWLCKEILSKGGEKVVRVSKSIYLVREHDGLGSLTVMEGEGSAPRKLSRKDVLQLLDELLSVAEVTT